MECAGFLRGFGKDVTVLYRSKILRGFDEDIVNKLVEFMKDHEKINFVKGVATSFEKEGEKIKVVLKTDGESKEHLFDNVLLAIGRSPSTWKIGLQELGVDMTPKGHLIVNDKYQTNVDSIYAIGDIRVGSPELTPVAVKEGIYLAYGLAQNKW